MNQSLPFLPGCSFRDITKTRYVFPNTLEFSKGVPIAKSTLSTSCENAMSLLDAQNKILDKEILTRLTYGPKKPVPKQTKLPRYLSMDKKVLRFTGYFREEINDWAIEKYRIRSVNVLYYLQNDTMEVVEPKVANSGLVQGTLFKRSTFPHPHGKGRCYLWKDLNLGIDLRVYGMCIRLTDCDEWTREYLINAGLELNEREEIPPDPYEHLKLSNLARKELHSNNFENEKFYKFLANDRKVLRFYGIWQDVLNDPPDMRRVIIQYYLADDTMELLEEHSPNNGRLPLKSVIKKQKIPKDRDSLSASFPSSFLEIKDGDVRFFKPEDLRTGKDIVVLGKKILLYDCDNFTKHFYKTQYNINMDTIKVAEKPKPLREKEFPPHTGIGGWKDSLQNCFSLIPKQLKKNFSKEMQFNGIALRYKAKLVTNIKDDLCRRFVITFYPSNDTIAINEEAIPNSGFPGGAFLKRNKLLKLESSLSNVPIYYQATDLHIGAEIRAAGKLFKLTDADRFVLTFMEQHPELYSNEQIEIHKKATTPSICGLENLELEKQQLLQSIRKCVIEKYGKMPYPLPPSLNPPLDFQHKDIINEELYCSNMPVEKTLIDKLLDLCTDSNNRTDMHEVRKILLPALGHSCL